MRRRCWQTQDLRVSYPVPLPGLRGWFKKDAFVAVQSASLSIPPGRTLGVVGESGSGKSTLALATLGLLPHEGLLRVTGTDWKQAEASGQARALRRHMQVVFQDPFSSLSPRLTVEQIVGEGLLVHEPQMSTAQRARTGRGGARRCGPGAGSGRCQRLAAALPARIFGAGSASGWRLRVP